MFTCFQMRSLQVRHNATPISSALVDYQTPGRDVNLYPMTPASMMHEEEEEIEIEIQLSQQSLTVTPRRERTPSSGRTSRVSLQLSMINFIQIPVVTSYLFCVCDISITSVLFSHHLYLVWHNTHT